MKKPKSHGRKQGPEPPKFTRHYETLTPKETDELVDAVAELFVNFVQKGVVDSLKTSQTKAGNTEAEQAATEECQGNPADGKRNAHKKGS